MANASWLDSAIAVAQVSNLDHPDGRERLRVAVLANLPRAAMEASARQAILLAATLNNLKPNAVSPESIARDVVEAISFLLKTY